MISNEKSRTSASSVLGAYNLQMWHALFELVKNSDKPNCIISIEGLDDVTIKEDVSLELNQIKNTTSSNNPLTNSSIDFWKSIYNWTRLVQDSRFHLKSKKCIFKLVVNSNHELNVGKIAGIFEKASNSKEAESAIEEAKKIINKPESRISENEYVKYCFDNTNKDDVCFVIRNFCINKYEKNYEKLFYQLFYKQDVENINETVLKAVMGWIFQRTSFYTSKNLPATFSVTEYKRELKNAIENTCLSESLEILSKRISDDAISDKLKETSVFIDQMRLIDLPSEQLLTNISYYLRTKTEIAKHAERGDVFDYESYSDNIKCKWESTKGIVLDEHDDNCDEKKIGRLILNNTCLSLSNIRLGKYVTDAFFSTGYAHFLADDLEIGWHPNYKGLLGKNE